MMAEKKIMRRKRTIQQCAMREDVSMSELVVYLTLILTSRKYSVK